jgi:hypothetical protein
LFRYGIFPRTCIQQVIDEPSLQTDVCTKFTNDPVSEISKSSRKKFAFPEPPKTLDESSTHDVIIHKKEVEDTSSGSDDDDNFNDAPLSSENMVESFRKLSLGRKPNQYLIETIDNNKIVIEINNDVIVFKTNVSGAIETNSFWNAVDVSANEISPQTYELVTPSTKYECKSSEALLNFIQYLIAQPKTDVPPLVNASFRSNLVCFVNQ